MVRHVLLLTLTEYGVKEIRNAPARIRENMTRYEAMGIKVMGPYLVGGEYDYVAIIESPSEEAAVAFVFDMGCRGCNRSAAGQLIDLGYVLKVKRKLDEPQLRDCEFGN